jgi:hypothetical protein
MDRSTIAHLTEADRAGPGDGREVHKERISSPPKIHSTFDFELNRTIFYESPKSQCKPGLNLPFLSTVCPERVIHGK